MAVEERIRRNQNKAPRAARAPRSGEKGAELLEFALVFSMLMALMLSIVVFARAYNVFQTVTRAAREGARMAVLPSAASAGNTFIDPPSACANPPATTNAPNTAIFNGYIEPALLASNLEPNNLQNYAECATWLNPSDADEQCGLVVSFQYPYPLTIPFLGTQLGTVTLNTRVQMRLENQSTTGTCP